MGHEIAAAFHTAGHNVARVNLSDLDSTLQFNSDIEENQVSLILSVGMYNDALYQFGERCTQQRIPMFFYGFDHPAFGYLPMKDMLAHFPKAIITFISDDFTNAAPRYLGNQGHFATLIQGVDPELQKSVPEHKEPFGLFVANLNNHPAMGGNPPPPDFYEQLWSNFPKEVRTELKKMHERVNRHWRKSLFDLTPPGARFQNGITPLHLIAEFDRGYYFRGRVNTVEALIPDEDCVVCGVGWDHLYSGSGRVRFLGSMDNDQVMSLMGQATFLINSTASYYSASERILEAAAIGCPVITTKTKFLEAEFGNSLWYYNDATSLRMAIRQIRSGENVAEKTERAKQIALERHSWAARVRDIIGILSDHGFKL